MLDKLEPRQLFANIVPTPTFGDRGAILVPRTTQLVRLSDNSFIGLSGDGAQTPYQVRHYGQLGQDKAYAGNGAVTFKSTADSTPQLAAAAKGRLAIAVEKSHNTFVVFRLKANGRIDPAFASPPLKVNQSVLAQTAGIAVDRFQRVYLGVKIHVANLLPVDYRVYRFNADGTLDRDYGSGGYAIAFSNPKLEATPLDIQPDRARTGTIFALVGHDRNAIVSKLNPDGQRDASFGQNGQIEFEAAPDAGFNAPPAITGLRIDHHDRPLVAGVDTDDYPTLYLTRRTASGKTDASFGSGGRLSLPTTKFASMEERLYDKILDYEISPADDSLYVLTDDAFYHFNDNGTGAAGTNDGLLDLGPQDTYPRFGVASVAATVGMTPKPMQFELGTDGRLFSTGYVEPYLQQYSSRDAQYRLVELAPAADAVPSRKTLYVSGSEGANRIRVTLVNGRVRLDRDGATTWFGPGKVSRVQIDLRQGDWLASKKHDEALVGAGLPAVIFGGPLRAKIVTVAPSIIVAGNGDTVVTGSGDDSLYLANNGYDGGQISAGAGNDLLVCAAQTFGMTADLGAGNDRLELSADESGGTFLLGDGDDHATVCSNGVSINGGRGVDRFLVTGYHNSIDGGPANDAFDVTGQSNKLLGGDGDDLFVLGANAMRDTVYGGAGTDRLRAVQTVTAKQVEVRH